MSGKLHFVPVDVFEFYLGVIRCPDGVARHALDLRTRGHDDWPEITVWPKTYQHRLTTGREYGGLGIPEAVNLTATEKKMAAILGLNELELHVFLREWQMPVPNVYCKGKSGGYPRPQTLAEIQAALYLFK